MIISRTPLRISFAGGGSDLAAYYQRKPGAVVSTAINKYIYITVNKKFDDMIRVSYSKTELVRSVDELEHNIVREAMKIVGIEEGVDIVYMGDLPSRSVGTGLGSSSSMAVGVLNALYAYVGRHASAEQLARDACRIEIELLGHPIGKQDQYIAAYGGLNYIQFNQDDSVFVDPVICTRESKRELGERLLLLFTGIDRISSSILKEQKEKTPGNVESIGEMVGLATRLRTCLVGNEVGGVGQMLHEGWEHKKKLSSGVTNPKVDEYYERAMTAGAAGGKICGAGGGGFLLLYCDMDKRESVRGALGELREMPFELEPQGSKIIYVSD